jgi:hypothetical protein
MEGFEIYSTVTRIHDHVERKRMAACKDLKKESVVHHGKHRVKGVQKPDLEFTAAVLLKLLDNLAPKMKTL